MCGDFSSYIVYKITKQEDRKCPVLRKQPYDSENRTEVTSKRL